MSIVKDSSQDQTVSIHTVEIMEISSTAIDLTSQCKIEKNEIYLELASYSSESEQDIYEESREENKKLSTCVVEYTKDSTLDKIASPKSDSINTKLGEFSVVDQAPHQDCDNYDIREETIKNGKIANNEEASILAISICESDAATAAAAARKEEQQNDAISENNDINIIEKEDKIENMKIEVDSGKENFVVNSSTNGACKDKTKEDDDSINGNREQRQNDTETVCVQGQGDDITKTIHCDNPLLDVYSPKIASSDYKTDDKSDVIQQLSHEKLSAHTGKLLDSSIKEEEDSSIVTSPKPQEYSENQILSVDTFSDIIVECEIRNTIEFIANSIKSDDITLEPPNKIDVIEAIETAANDVVDGSNEQYHNKQLTTKETLYTRQDDDHQTDTDVDNNSDLVADLAEIIQEKTESIITVANGQVNHDSIDKNDICFTNEEVEKPVTSSFVKKDMALTSDHISDISAQPIESNNDATSRTNDDDDDDDDDSFLDDDDLDNELDDNEKEPLFVARQVVVKRNKNPRNEYTLQEELGRGKFGTVYRCVDKSNGTNLAAKFIHLRRKEDREDVEREVDIMKSLQHKRLLQLYDAFDDGLNEMCLILELVEGGELFERVIDDDFKLTEKMAAIFMRQICEGVQYMHEQNIVHLDMKPENILCVSKKSNRIKLIDFGLARRLVPNAKLQVLFGTPDFAAPEVLSYDKVTPATDMWSVGVICYVLLSGLSPFMGDTDLETMTNVTKAAYDFEDEAFDPISDSARDFISKLLIKDQALRMTPSECLNHNWLTKTKLTSANINRDIDGNEAFDQSLDKTKLRKYVVRRKWQKAIHAILALRRMGATF